MQRNLSCTVMTLVLLVTVSSCLVQEASAWKLVDHCMCKDVDNTTYSPISKTDYFLYTDEKAVLWLELDITDLSGKINVTSMWYDPKAVLYNKINSVISGGDSWTLWHWISIKNNPPAGNPGVWHVDVYANGGPFKNTKLFTEAFFIDRPYEIMVSVSGFPPTLSANLWVDDKLFGKIAGGASQKFTAMYGTTHKFAVDRYVNATTGTRYYCSANTWNTSSEASHIFSYRAQYYLTVNSTYGSPKGAGWYDEKTTAQFEVTSPIDHGNATRHVFTGWSGDSTATTPTATVTMDSPKTVKATWKTQYQLTVTSAFGSLTGSGWYDSGSTATFAVTPSTLDHGNGTRRLFVGWTGDSTATTPSASIAMDKPKTVAANWKKQFYLTVNSPYGPPTGSGWYDSGSSATFSVPSSYPLEGFMGALGGKYVFQSWSGDSTEAIPTATIKMDAPKTVAATWATDLTMPYAIIGGIIVVIAAAIGIAVIKLRKRASAAPPVTAPPPPPTLPRQTKYCINCGAQIPIAATFCTECGKKQ